MPTCLNQILTAVLCSISMIVQIRPRKHVPDHAECAAPTRSHQLDDIVSALKDLDHWESVICLRCGKRGFITCRVFAVTIIQPIIPSNLKKARFHSGIILTCVCDERIAEIPSDHNKIPGANLVSKKGKFGWHRVSTASYFRNTEKRYPCVTTSAAPVCDSSSSTAEATAAAAVAGAAKAA